MGKGVRAIWKLLLKMSAACKGGRNVHELFFLPCSGCCLVTASILQTCFHHVPANLYGQYLTRDALVPLFRPPCRPKSMLERQQEQSFVSGFFLGHMIMHINIEFGGKGGPEKSLVKY